MCMVDSCLGFGPSLRILVGQAVRSFHGYYPNRWMFDILAAQKSYSRLRQGSKLQVIGPHRNVKQMTALRGGERKVRCSKLDSSLPNEWKGQRKGATRGGGGLAGRLCDGRC